MDRQHDRQPGAGAQQGHDPGVGAWQDARKRVGQFSEPIDIEFGNGKVYVGDANGGNVKILNPATGA